MNREKELLNNCIGYLAELWERDNNKEWENHWQNIIGMTTEELKEYDLVRDED